MAAERVDDGYGRGVAQSRDPDHDDISGVLLKRPGAAASRALKDQRLAGLWPPASAENRNSVPGHDRDQGILHVSR